jgi:hypothetical protein
MSKNISKRNEEKLKIYLKKINDTKPGNKQDKSNSAGTQAGAQFSGRISK